MILAVDQVREKLKWAKHHIYKLHEAVWAFTQTNPYRIRAKRDPQTRKLIYYISSAEETPPNIACITGDALQNMRSALDHLAWQLVIAAGSTPRIGVTGFPISDSAVKYKAEAGRKIQGMRQQAMDTINAIKPYKGGNDTLWRLHRLNNRDKHRALITHGCALRSIGVGPPQAGSGKWFNVVPANRLFPLEVGTELFVDVPDAKENDQLQFTFDIAFDEPGVVQGQSVMETLHGMADVVDSTISNLAPFLL